MKFSVDKNIFQKSLQKVCPLAASKPTSIQVISNVMLSLKGDVLTLTTTDLEIEITVNITVKGENDGITSVPAKKTQLIVNHLKGDIIDIEANDRHYTEIRCGNADFTIAGLPADDFPSFDASTPIRVIKFNSGDFLRTLDQVSYGVSPDDSRKALHGILLSLEDNIFTAVTTDGKRLALVEKTIDGFDGENGDTIITIKTANELKRVSDKEEELVLEIGKDYIICSSGGTKITSKILEGSFPKFRNVIPNSFTKEIEITTDQFLSSLELVSLGLQNEENNYIQLKFHENKTDFSIPGGFATDSLPIEYEYEELTVSFNPQYIIEPFKHSPTDKMIIKANDGVQPIGIQNEEGFYYVIMPVRNKKKK